MKKGTFQRPAKVLLQLINTKTMPTQSDTDVSRVKVCLIYALLTRIKFDLENIMLEHMARVWPVWTRCLFYPSMITLLLRTHHVEEEPHSDRTILIPRSIKAFDVTTVIDPPPLLLLWTRGWFMQMRHCSWCSLIWSFTLIGGDWLVAYEFYF